MENTSPIAMGSDHAGFALKEFIKNHLIAANFKIEDCGAFSENLVDYPDFGIEVAEKVASGMFERGILICGTGLGMSMVANRFKNVRAALCNDLFLAMMSRRHNDANILVMGGRVIGTELAREIVTVWLKTPFEEGRHRKRIEKFDAIASRNII
ncbi:MAG: ribose 5-phosphate isomerase B [Desulfobacterales bacterium CG23_combo_of_CG06-09_8_20_14_all_51_8]|nr:MAG: ribose 5-phosphate isomerase B [Desulfobacterales bacterium CG23_combo_of_CG06-09_8_20_14_all_51_8]